MKTAFRLYLKKPQTIVAIVAALMAQIIFIVCWMTSYDGVLDRTSQLRIAVVNEDGAAAEALVAQLKQMPFDVTTPSKAIALRELDERKTHLVITIPARFAESLGSPDARKAIRYTVNQANPQVTKGVIDSVVAKLNAQLDRLASPDAAQLKTEMQIVHPVNGMNNQMVPMMLVLASYVGAMLMAMNVHQASMAIGQAISRRQHFAVRASLILIAALIISLAGSSLMRALGGQMENGFGAFWLFHFLILLTFMFFAQMFLIALGMAGMFANMAMLSLQLVTSGTIVPRQMLSAFYESLGHYLPATYAVEGLMDLGFGVPFLAQDALALGTILLASAGISWAVLRAKDRRTEQASGAELSVAGS
ncbi:ABC transporter permease [Cohnella ginsengisoli]|uniref:ABC transporter permease n=1 Tax=Cohnella ginsengisoli TaxID=425004 RepID=A0A9X4QPX5_9BACL|nr:ABC transporter permease [Cohnella ginsengisoli]MDG0793986.1 ABC transporter permease [Cohnella ginsengisoli]